MRRRGKKVTARRIAVLGCVLSAIIYFGPWSLLSLLPRSLSSGSDNYKAEVEALAADAAKQNPQQVYIGCQRASDLRHAVLENTSAFMKVNDCTSTCYRKNFYYSLIEGGSSCYCSYVAGIGSLATEVNCNSACPGKADQFCGGVGSASVYLVREPDGHNEWTEWMSLEASSVASRYRGCNRASDNGTCHISLERRHTDFLEIWEKGVYLYYLGCFTMGGFNAASKKAMQSDWPTVAQECMSACWFYKKRYMALQTHDTNRWCMCVSDIGTSLPVDTCSNQYGVQLFSTGKIHASMTLYFSAPQSQRKALLMGVSNGGLSAVASFVSRYPKTFFVDEPDILLLSSQWAENPADATVSFFNKVLDPYFACRLRRVPGMFLLKYSNWGKGNSGFVYYQDCIRLFYATTGIGKCLPALEESCRGSAVLASKTTRSLDQSLLNAYIESRGNNYYIHMVRDPRAVIAARQAAQPAFQEFNTASIAKSVCNDMVRIIGLFKQPKDGRHLLTVFYEDVATDSRNASAALYRDLRVNVTDQLVGDVLQSMFGNSTDKSDRALALRGSATAWRKTLDQKTIGIIDKHCSQVYAEFPQWYTASPVVGRGGE